MQIPKQKSTYDVVIVGAGISGLVCAQELLKRNKNILVLEGQPRIGGRILTVKNRFSDLPLEMGAEFIHGESPEIMNLAESAFVPYYDVIDKHYFFHNTKSPQLIKEYWDIFQSILEKIPRKTAQDRSVRSFLNSIKIPQKNKKLFTSFVEGFHSADLELMSAKGLYATEEVNENNTHDSQLFRWQNGYSDFLHPFTKADSNLKDKIQFNVILKKIDWRHSTLSLSAQDRNTREEIKIKCRKIVVTVPVSILQASATSMCGIEWLPSIPRPLKNSLDALHMGFVEKLNFTFRNRFWEKLVKTQPCFFHTTPELYFPTWWTQMPIRSPHLIGWQGGPKAKEMSEWSEDKKIEKALQTLSILCGQSLKKLSQDLLSCETHNWSHDPFSLGAYSYVATEGLKAAARLASVFENKIAIAGEGTMSGSSRGTVHGAFRSGIRAAKQILAIM